MSDEYKEMRLYKKVRTRQPLVPTKMCVRRDSKVVLRQAFLFCIDSVLCTLYSVLLNPPGKAIDVGWLGDDDGGIGGEIAEDERPAGMGLTGEECAIRRQLWIDHETTIACGGQRAGSGVHVDDIHSLRAARNAP